MLIVLIIFMLLYKTVPLQKVKVGEIFPGGIRHYFLMLLSFVFSFFMNRFFKFARFTEVSPASFFAHVVTLGYANFERRSTLLTLPGNPGCKKVENNR